MPKSALPEHLQDVENAFPDDEQFGTSTWWGRAYRWYNKKTKTWFAFSYRCTEWWARWRMYPKVLFAVSEGSGTPWRWEGDGDDGVTWETILVNRPKDTEGVTSKEGVWRDGYLSRIQYWKRWHFAIQWPLMVSFHFYPKAEDVPEYGRPRPELDGKLWFAYWGHFDADLVYWMLTSAYLGRNWK